mmetsp:Transcript_26236/g.83046  ORF Transcript_26236/g.83046 Transcript_26236/m.83046 type:complete len:704 (+) Transcript_26236:449-2560(+)
MEEEAGQQTQGDVVRWAEEEGQRLVNEEGKQEAERQVKEKAESQAQEEAKRLAEEGIERLAKKEAEREVQHEAEQWAKEETESLAEEEAVRQSEEAAKEQEEGEAAHRAWEEAERQVEVECRAQRAAERPVNEEEAEQQTKEEEATRLATEGAAEREVMTDHQGEADGLAQDWVDQRAKEKTAQQAEEEYDRRARREVERRAMIAAKGQAREATRQATEEADQQAQLAPNGLATEGPGTHAEDEAEEQEKEQTKRWADAAEEARQGAIKPAENLVKTGAGCCAAEVTERQTTAEAEQQEHDEDEHWTEVSSQQRKEHGCRVTDEVALKLGEEAERPTEKEEEQKEPEAVGWANEESRRQIQDESTQSATDIVQIHEHVGLKSWAQEEAEHWGQEEAECCLLGEAAQQKEPKYMRREDSERLEAQARGEDDERGYEERPTQPCSARGRCAKPIGDGRSEEEDEEPAWKRQCRHAAAQHGPVPGEGCRQDVAQSLALERQESQDLAVQATTPQCKSRLPLATELEPLPAPRACTPGGGGRQGAEGPAPQDRPGTGELSSALGGDWAHHDEGGQAEEARSDASVERSAPGRGLGVFSPKWLCRKRAREEHSVSLETCISAVPHLWHDAGAPAETSKSTRDTADNAEECQRLTRRRTYVGRTQADEQVAAATLVGSAQECFTPAPDLSKDTAALETPAGLAVAELGA